jgi:hypothetical protein
VSPVTRLAALQPRHHPSGVKVCCGICPVRPGGINNHHVVAGVHKCIHCPMFPQPLDLIREVPDLRKYQGVGRPEIDDRRSTPTRRRSGSQEGNRRIHLERMPYAAGAERKNHSRDTPREDSGRASPQDFGTHPRECPGNRHVIPCVRIVYGAPTERMTRWVHFPSHLDAQAVDGLSLLHARGCDPRPPVRNRGLLGTTRVGYNRISQSSSLLPAGATC